MTNIHSEELHIELQTHWKKFFVLGIVLLLLGILAIVLPLATSIVIELLVGALLLIGGIGVLVHAFLTPRIAGFLPSFLLGVFQILVGGLFLFNPLKGVIALTLLLAIFFILEGLLKTLLSMGMRLVPSWGWLFFNGVLALILGILILALWPEDVWVIGILVGVNFLVGGISVLMFSLALRVLAISPRAND